MEVFDSKYGLKAVAMKKSNYIQVEVEYEHCTTLNDDVVIERFDYEWYKDNEYFMEFLAWLLKRGEASFQEYFREFVYIPYYDFKILDARVVLVKDGVAYNILCDE